MARKTYLSKLYILVYTLCVYNARWGGRIRENLRPDLVPFYDALTMACDEFLKAFGVPEVNP